MSKARELAELGNVYSDGALSNRNLIINGAMAISQRYGTSASNLGGSSVFSVDRFNCFGPAASSTSTGQQVTDTPAGFKNSLKYTCGTGVSVTGGDYAQIQQTLEGNNTAHLKWGTSDAQDVVVSFWVKSSLTGTFAFIIQNGGFSRSYVAQYQINAANTWEYKTIAVAGDTSGTWATDNTASLRIIWDMGFGYGTTSTVDAWQAGDVHYVSGNVKVNETSGATFYLTGVQLEVGDTATPFEHRSYGQEFALCQRYFTKLGGEGVGDVYGAGYITGSGFILDTLTLPVKMRSFPTSTVVGTWNVTNVAQPTLPYMSSTTAILYAQGTVVGQGLYNNPALTGYLTFDAEL